jgi:hypothetical protein
MADLFKFSVKIKGCTSILTWFGEKGKNKREDKDLGCGFRLVRKELEGWCT